MKLYGDRISSSTRRVLTTASCVGLDVDFHPIDLRQRENRSADFLRLNPNGTIPVLVDRTTVLFESSVIMMYLAAMRNSPLAPEGLAKYEMMKWSFWAAEHFRLGPNILLEERYLKPWHGESPDASNIARGEALVRRHAAVLDHVLERRPFIAGDQVSLADFDIAAPFSHQSRSRAPFHEFPNVVAWHQRLLQTVPAWRASGEALEARARDIEHSGSQSAEVEEVI